MQLIYKKEKNNENFCGNEWMPKHIFNELGHLDNLYHKFSRDIKLFIYHNIIFRLFVLQLIMTFDIILEQVTLDYSKSKDVIIADYFNNFQNDLERSQFIYIKIER